MLLPEELVHDIFSYLAYHSKPRMQCELPELQFECNTTDILSLSLVNRRLRRIGLPFLFASLRIKGLTDVKKLKDQGPLFFKYTKMLILRMLSLLDEEGMEILLQSIPHLKRLTCVDARCTMSIALLNALHEHPNVSTIHVQKLPKGSVQFDLSKVVLKQSELADPRRCWLAPSGMKVSQLIIRQPELLTDEFGLQTFNGLCELDLSMRRFPVIVSWLPEFTAAHPNLKKIRFIYGRKDFFTYHTLPFISSFVEEAGSRKLADAYYITRFFITRPDICSTSAQEWRVTGLTIIIRSSLIEILSLIYSSFPSIQTLTFEFEGRPARGLYHIDDIIAILCLFSSLEILGLHCLFKPLHFGCRKPWRAPQLETPSAADIAEAGILWYTSRIAQRIPSLQAFEIHEEAYYDEANCCSGRWFVKGWLNVQNALSGGREVVGILKKT
ncbi:hypothetical protein BT96DRAFT_1025806 [Gymnopus androsaceus JB14]|uniref:F-box domain-containing protein n=1 Tax=Gymnopus androsaceus JB14 TaxID=1447944 RepID=A0A6A4GQX5_9AGAR|nr:hypothetical protein BT96DRAFT_1025806 [Gymnopus androsaceus JB14]